MNLAAIADIADVLAAVGVIASLLYVGYQVRETRKAVRSATAQARTDLGVQLISSRWTSDISDILVKSLEHPDALTSAERFKLKSFFSAHVRFCQNLHYQQKQGLLDEYFSFGIARTTAYWVRNYPWAAEEWESVQAMVPEEFVAFIDDELRKHPEEYDA